MHQSYKTLGPAMQCFCMHTFTAEAIWLLNACYATTPTEQTYTRLPSLDITHVTSATRAYGAIAGLYMFTLS